ncbi:CPS_collapsed_G0017730.mRNA.1.CDS.1 [Saccharomyces cerevisiae]|nr:CPS_collapsed_G0017730.mRNA.1.CDS.1 [Saccharomyces cerevisiae]
MERVKHQVPLGENYPQTTKGTDQSVYDITSLFNDLPRTLDPNQDKLAVTNQDEPPPEIKSPLKQAGLVSFFAPKLNGKQIFSRRHVENQKSLSLDEINITDLPAKQENVEMPTEKKMANILYYEGISSHSQDNYDPPWLFGVEATQSADCFKIYSKKKIIVSRSPANINYNNQIITRIKVRFLITLSFLGIPEEDQ